jgi:hypothetical protein
MSDDADERLERLAGTYRNALDAGERPELGPLLDDAGPLADDLLAIIDLIHAERRPATDDAAFAAFLANEETAPSTRELLTAAREHTGLLRREAVVRVTAALGLPVEARDRVGRRLHELETGRLPITGLAPVVLQVIGRVFGIAADVLARAAPPPHLDDGVLYARSPDAIRAAAPPATHRAAAVPPVDPIDPVAAAVDRLFGVDGR